jgi:activating signal cointegrator complex subunit 3
MSYKTVAKFNQKLHENNTLEDILNIYSESNEFTNMKMYNEEKPELELLARKFNMISLKDTIDNISKPIILLKTYLHGNYDFKVSSLFMDTMYLVDNSPRIFRAIAEIAMHKKLVSTSFVAINFMKSIEHRIYPEQTPLWQFTYESFNNKVLRKNKKTGGGSSQGYLKSDICRKIDAKGYQDIKKIMTSPPKDVTLDLNISMSILNDIKGFVKHRPRFKIEVETKPITRTILNITLTLEPIFKWSKRWNGLSEVFWVLVDNKKEIIHQETFSFTPKRLDEADKNFIPKLKEVVLSFAVPFEIESGQEKAKESSRYMISIISDKWVDCRQTEIIELSEITVPQDEDIKTELLDLYPLPVSILKNKEYESVFDKYFKFFNPIQTQIFYSVYHSDENLLVGAPTGSGKTVIAELAILRLFSKNKDGKIIYIAPLKSL